MVQPGQYLERPALIAVGPCVLEGLWHRGTVRPPVLILSPPWQEGGSMDHVAVAELAWACASAGRPSLRFNYRGVGGSQGERGTLKDQREDAAAALDLLAENTGTKGIALVALAGASDTALALSKALDTVVGVALISPADEALALWKSGVPVPWHVVEADPQFRKRLPDIGKSVLQWLERISSSEMKKNETSGRRGR